MDLDRVIWIFNKIRGIISKTVKDITKNTLKNKMNMWTDDQS